METRPALLGLEPIYWFLISGSRSIVGHCRFLQNNHHKPSLCFCLLFTLYVWWLNFCVLMYRSNAEITAKIILQTEAWYQVLVGKFFFVVVVVSKWKNLFSFEIKYANKSWGSGAIEKMKDNQGTHSGVGKSTRDPYPLVGGKVLQACDFGGWFFFWGKVLLYRPDLPGTHCVVQSGLELTDICLPLLCWD